MCSETQKFHFIWPSGAIFILIFELYIGWRQKKKNVPIFLGLRVVKVSLEHPHKSYILWTCYHFLVTMQNSTLFRENLTELQHFQKGHQKCDFWHLTRRVWALVFEILRWSFSKCCIFVKSSPNSPKFDMYTQKW